MAQKPQSVKACQAWPLRPWECFINSQHHHVSNWDHCGTNGEETRQCMWNNRNAIYSSGKTLPSAVDRGVPDNLFPQIWSKHAHNSPHTGAEWSPPHGPLRNQNRKPLTQEGHPHYPENKDKFIKYTSWSLCKAGYFAWSDKLLSWQATWICHVWEKML